MRCSPPKTKVKGRTSHDQKRTGALPKLPQGQGAMRFLSLFSGIEAASVAWESLGWTCVAVAEIEKFPSEVLRIHYPSVQNLGDVTKINRSQIDQIGRIDLVIGGFPCQDVSVAGKRKGLKNADGTYTRSGLFFDAMRIIEWAKPRWTLVENVPGLFSSNGGSDFGAVVGELAGAKFDVPREGWRTSGFALGKKGLVEWRVLDAQFFGLAQRRKRVFIVRDSGNWAGRPPLLLERESLRWNPPKGRETREGTAPTISARTKGGGGLSTDAECDGAVIAATLTKNYATHHGRSAGNNGGVAANQLIPQLSPAIKSRDCKGPSSDGDGDGAPLIPVVAHSVSAGRDGYNDGSDQTCVPVAFSVKDHGADAGELAPTLRAGNHDGSHANGGCGPAIAFQPRFFTRENKTGNADSCGETVPALSADHGGGDSAPHVAFQPRIARNGRGDMGDKANALQSQSGQTGKGDAAPCVASVAGVRRLTPTECERLQGFPDGYTAIPWRGKPADQCPDGPRYRALGNSMAVPVIRWIGERIQLIEKTS